MFAPTRSQAPKNPAFVRWRGIKLDMSKLSEVLRERGYVHQHSSETLEELADGQKRTVYLGIDPSADSLHVGNLQAMLVLRRFLEDGHKVILLIGGGTGMIGDPSGKSEERNLLDDATIDSNATAIAAQGSCLFNGMEFTLLNNADWLRGLNYIEFLRDIGKHFSVNAMLQRDSVKERLLNQEQGISYTEFSYMLLQSYDYLHLHTAHGCDVQIGASDQWGNILSGVDLIRRKSGNTVFAFTSPLLINKSTGKKFGKSEQGAVWLDATKTSPFDFYQFFLNVEDNAVEELLLKMTLLPKEEIDTVIEVQSANPGGRAAQKKLAHSVTSLVHSETVAGKVERVSQLLFGNESVTGDDWMMIAEHAPSRAVQEGSLILDVLVDSSLASSKREAREYISGNAITLNGQAVPVDRPLTTSDFQNGHALLKRGKRSVAVLRLN